MKETITKSAKTAGYAYLIIIVTSVLSLIIGSNKLMVEGDMATSIKNISSNQTLFRFSLTYELLMYLGVIILSVALYNTLKIVNKTNAIIALLSRFGEAFMGSLTVVCSVIILYLVNSDLSSENTQQMVVLTFEVKDVLMLILMAFIGLGTILFCFNFYKSRFIPRWLSIFGIIAFTMVLVESIIKLLFPLEVTIFAGLLAIIFEFIIGIWLIIKKPNFDYIEVENK